ncbi:MAG: THUMP domain-containing protein [Burkholderiaceae bacterium]
MERNVDASLCFAPCPRGLEDVLVDELRELDIAPAHATAGGVHFTASWPDAMRINLHSRIASRVLVRIVQGRYRTEDDIHRLAHAQDWTMWFDAGQTLRVDTTAGSGKNKSGLKSLEFVTLRVKDGICDRFRDAVGERPSIDTRQPDVRVFAYLDANTCTLYLDTTGEPLFKRGWRAESGDAPLRENLAAGILRLAGWKPGIALLDPMCGSGSFVVEAAQTALKIAPGETRVFGFEKLKNFDSDAWERMRNDSVSMPDAEALAAVALIQASDVSGDAVAMTRANLERAGIPAELALQIAPKQIDARQVKPQADSGLVIANPPYGERIAIRGERSERGNQSSDDELTVFFGEFGNTLKQRFAGWTCHILTSDMNLQRKLRLSPDRRVVLFNGAIECRLYRFELVSGQHR